MITFRKLLSNKVIFKDDDCIFDDGECELYVVREGYSVITVDGADDTIDTIQLNKDGSIVIEYQAEWSETFNNIDTDIHVAVFKKVELT